MKIKPCKPCKTDQHLRFTKLTHRFVGGYKVTRWTVRCCNCGKEWSTERGYKETATIWNNAN